MSTSGQDSSPFFTYTLPSGEVASTIDRRVAECRPVSRVILSDSELFQTSADGRETINMSLLREHFFDEGRLSDVQVLKIVSQASEILRAEPNLLEVSTPVTICGDIHGQYYDLLKLFEVAGGEPPTNRFLFLGDYVDRGYFSFECFLYMAAMKINFPEHLFLLRGNHESRNLTRHFTFKAECVYKYGEPVYEACMLAFDCLPLAALVNYQFFCAHGGISPEMKSPKDLNKVNRIADPPRSGMVCDILWSDPTESFDKEDFADTDMDDFVANGTRGCSFRYSFRGVVNFLERNGLLAVVRGHEAQAAGYRLYQKAPGSDFPALITLFSAANYVDVYKNKGACMKYDGKVMNIRQFNAAPHPYYLPKFMNAFDWSLPFVGEKMAELFMAVLNLQTKESPIADLTAEERAQLNFENAKRESMVKNKIRAVARINRMFQTVRNERETLTELMNVMGTKHIPSQYLILSGEELRAAIANFEQARMCDEPNEMLPSEDALEDTSSVYSMVIDDEDYQGSPDSKFAQMEIDDGGPEAPSVDRTNSPSPLRAK